MSKQNVSKRWMAVVALALLLSLFTLAVQASPPPAPLLGFTPTPEAPPTVTVIAPSLSACDPELIKQVSPSMAKPGDLVTFTIKGQIGLIYDEDNLVTLTPPDGVADPDLSNNTALVGSPYRALLVLVFRNADID